jgi:acetyl esterase/lipase
MHPADLLARTSSGPDLELRYGPGPDQVADLRLPAAHQQPAGGAPLVIFLHGGFWRAAYDRRHTGPLAAALASAGFAVCTPEYRRTGQPAGGWPGTFDDVAAAVDVLPEAAVQAGGAAIDGSCVVLAGHSAGGQLALWAASRARLPAGSAWFAAQQRAHAVVSLAGVCDLAECFRLDLGDGAAVELLGGSPAQFPERYAATDPMALLPAGVPVRLVHGVADDRVPSQLSRSYAQRARAAGDDASCDLVAGCGHFELIDPSSAAWPSVLAAFRSAAGGAA